MCYPEKMKYKIILLAGLMLCGFFLSAQTVIRGRVVDADTQEPVSHVDLIINGSNFAGVTDIDGKFALSVAENVKKLQLSCYGYQTAEIIPDLTGNEIILKLKKQETTNAPDLIEVQRIIDSISNAENQAIADKTNGAIIKGRLSLGMVELDMNRIIHYNRYQGLYLGLGLHTNDKFSSRFRLGGYWGYGFASKSATYGADGTIVIHKLSETKLKLELAHDVSESGGMPDFGEIKRLFDPSGFHNLLVRRMDLLDLSQVTVSTGVVKYLRAGVSYFQSVKRPNYEYAYVRSQDGGLSVLANQFHFSGLSFNLRYAYGEKIPKEKGAGKSPAVSFPVIRMQLTRGISGWPGSDYSYARFDLKIEQTFTAEHFGRTSLSLLGGVASGDLPYCNLFDGRGGYGKFTIFAPQSFATMRMNEFVSDRYASFFLMHAFGKVLKPSKYFNPEPVICAGAGTGDLKHPEKHRYINIRTLTKGYYETGLLVNNLLDLKVYNIGLGAFYRLGQYAFPAFSDNIAFKFSLNFPL